MAGAFAAFDAAFAGGAGVAAGFAAAFAEVRDGALTGAFPAAFAVSFAGAFGGAFGGAFALPVGFTVAALLALAGTFVAVLAALTGAFVAVLAALARAFVAVLVALGRTLAATLVAAFLAGPATLAAAFVALVAVELRTVAGTGGFFAGIALVAVAEVFWADAFFAAGREAVALVACLAAADFLAGAALPPRATAPVLLAMAANPFEVLVRRRRGRVRAG